LVVLEIAVRAVTAGMNHALRDPLMVEVENLFTEMKIFERSWPPSADP